MLRNNNDRVHTDAHTIDNNPGLKIISVTGGKGGIGKTNVSINLAISMAKQGKRVLLMDADLGLANIDILLGLKSRKNLSHVIQGEASLKDILINGPEGITIIPAASGIQSMCQLDDMQHTGLIHAFSELTSDYDVLLVDTAAGISKQVSNFAGAAHEVLIVVCNEPGSITDAYALIKVMSNEHDISKFRILSNMVRGQAEGRELFHKLKKTADQFLDITLDYLGHLPYDEHIRLSVQSRRAVVDLFPKCLAAKAFTRLCKKINAWPINEEHNSRIVFFIERFVNQSTPIAAEEIA